MDLESLKKNSGDTLEASEWNSLVDEVKSKQLGNALPNFYINTKGNLNIETSVELGNTSKGKINIESMDDIQFKPGDDIILYSHHRALDKLDEVAVKVTNGEDVPVKLQLNAADLTLTTKDKAADEEILNINVNTGKTIGNKKGYLKVRARAIDLRCEEHGGIALQPKGADNNGHMNKIKFEHGGGDGLEFGTFNSEKTSLFTDEYRFNKNGVVKMATREVIDSPKANPNDPTTLKNYTKNPEDDFYDIINPEDKTATWEGIINAGNAFKTPGEVSLKGKLDFGSSFSFGETDQGIEVLYKRTKKGNLKDCGVIKVVAQNNHETEPWQYNEGTLLEPISEQVIAEASIIDMITLVNYMKNNHLGPWDYNED